jgi:hypothetical protein
MAVRGRQSGRQVSWSTTTGSSCDPPHTAVTVSALQGAILREKEKAHGGFRGLPYPVQELRP